MSADKPGLIGSAIFRSETLPSEAEQRRLQALADSRGIETFASIELERIEGGNGLLAFTGAGPDHGTLWVQGTRHDVDVLGRAKVRVTFEGDPLTPRYLVRANGHLILKPAPRPTSAGCSS